MAKLTKAEWKAHEQAVALVENGRELTTDERAFIVDHWHPGAVSDQTSAGVFFTPEGLAHDFHLEVPGWGSVVDLCAGIGGLAFYATCQPWRIEDRPAYDRIVCVERNPAFVAVGKRVMPDAHWICGDVLDPAVWAEIGRVDFAFLNPPFGRMMRSDFKPPRYRGAEAEFKVLDVAMMVAGSGAAIIPTASAPFSLSGGYRRQISSKFAAFFEATGVSLHGGVGIACEIYRGDWKGVAPSVEVVTWNIEENEDAAKPAFQGGVAANEPPKQLAFAV